MGSGAGSTVIHDNDVERLKQLLAEYPASNAQGWARYGAKDEKLAQWLEEAERQRERKR